MEEKQFKASFRYNPVHERNKINDVDSMTVHGKDKNAVKALLKKWFIIVGPITVFDYYEKDCTINGVKVK